MEQPEKMETDLDIWEDFNLPLMDIQKLTSSDIALSYSVGEKTKLLLYGGRDLYML